MADRTNGKRRSGGAGMVNAARRASVSLRRRNVTRKAAETFLQIRARADVVAQGGYGPGHCPTARVRSGRAALMSVVAPMSAFLPGVSPRKYDSREIVS